MDSDLLSNLKTKTTYTFEVTFYHYNSGAADNGFTTHTLYFEDYYKAIAYHKKCKQWELESNDGTQSVETDRNEYEELLNKYVWYHGYLYYVDSLYCVESIYNSKKTKINY